MHYEALSALGDFYLRRQRFWKPPEALRPLMVPVLPVKWAGLPAAARICRCPAAPAGSELGL